MKRYKPANHIPLLSLLPWDGGLKNRTFTQHLVGQKMYELTSHLGNVQAVISDQRYVRVNEDDTRLFRAAVPALYDYYPFGMLMKERTTQDTATHTMTATQIVNVPNMVTAPLPLTGWSSVYGAAISYSGGVVASGYTGGMSRSLGGLVPGVMATITLELKYVRKAPCHITVTDDVTSAVIASQSVGSGGFYSLSFTPTGNNVTLSIVEGVSFASSDKLIHLVTGTYTQQQGWTTAPLAVQLTNKDADKYKFGFNGQEKDNEIAGVGNHTTALFWEYDTRIARRWNIDPVDQISISNYSVMRLNPILFNDPLGDCVTCKEQGVGYKYEKKDKAELEDVVVRAKRPDHLKPSSEKSASGGWMLGGGGSITIWQASEKRVGYNAYNRQRADWSRNIAAGWLGAGFGVPAAVVGGVK